MPNTRDDPQAAQHRARQRSIANRLRQAAATHLNAGRDHDAIERALDNLERDIANLEARAAPPYPHQRAA